MIAKTLRHPSFWGIVVALLVVVPQLRYAQFNSDDYSHLAVLEGIEIHRGMGPLTLYSFINGDEELLQKRVELGPDTWFYDDSVIVLDVDESGIRRARFQFEQSLDDEIYRIFAWREGKLSAVEVPPVGGTIPVN
jgi:hypothetical protein